jgi:hypothetical protein
MPHWSTTKIWDGQYGRKFRRKQERSDRLKNQFDILQQLRLHYGFRAETLVPDIAFVGLIVDYFLKKVIKLPGFRLN